MLKTAWILLIVFSVANIGPFLFRAIVAVKKSNFDRRMVLIQVGVVSVRTVILAAFWVSVFHEMIEVTVIISFVCGAIHLFYRIRKDKAELSTSDNTLDHRAEGQLTKEQYFLMRSLFFCFSFACHLVFYGGSYTLIQYVR